MKTIYNILIISILGVSNAWSQDSLKNKYLKIEIEENESIHNLLERKSTNSTENSKKRVEGLLNELRASAKNRSYSYSFPTPPMPPLPPMPPFENQNFDRSHNSEDNPIEKKKTITKTFNVDSKDRLSISNQHGDVKIELWDKNEIKVDITITGYGTSEAKAQELIDNVEITDKREGGKISFKTFIDSDNNSWSWGNNWSWNGKKDDENCNCPKAKKGVEINYNVYMPRTNALSVSNKYGKTIIPQFDAPLKVTSNYGSFTSDRLKGLDKDIFVQYGSSNIKQMDDGDLQISYSKLNVDKADNLKLKNNYGSVTLDDINNLDGTFQYSSGKIGRINETGKLNISYSDGVQLSEMSKTLKSLHINSNYTAVKLPVNGDCNADFEVTTTYANFRYPTGKVTFSVNPDENDDDDRKMGWQSTKTYKGKIGKGSNTKITIKTNYAGVKFMEK
ncbi:MAG: hypothetical protein RLZZ306_1210 [Bacteroidota bacterium]|jgi:hypothetical protein